MNLFGLLIVTLMLTPWLALGVGGVLLLRSALRGEKRVVLFGPARQMLTDLFGLDESTQRQIDRALGIVAGISLAGFGLSVAVTFGTLAWRWSQGG